VHLIDDDDGRDRAFDQRSRRNASELWRGDEHQGDQQTHERNDSHQALTTRGTTRFRPM
jgi:hypothetical protein